MCYDSIEFEPSPPTAWLRFAEIRAALKQEMDLSAGNRGWFGNAQSTIMAMPNIYFFARGTADPQLSGSARREGSCRPGRIVGRPAGVADSGMVVLAAEPRQTAGRSSGETACREADRPGGPVSAGRSGPISGDSGGPRRLADSRLAGVQQTAKTPEEAAAAVADGTAALVDWWKLNRYCGEGDGNQPFGWGWVHGISMASEGLVQAERVRSGKVSELAVKKIVADGTLDEQAAKRSGSASCWRDEPALVDATMT